MTKYLLLRDNKETGPYSFDEIRAKGLKAYDLVWVEGKSAAWRYPCEVEELSPFAPVVEEQPFDRFYKKPSQNQQNSSATPAMPSTPLVATSVFAGESSSIPGKRIIYVTMPPGKGNSIVRETRELPGSAPATPHEKYLPVFSMPEGSPAGIEENNAQEPVVWKRDVEITPRHRKNTKLIRMGQSVAVALCVVALLATGVFIGLSINKNSRSFTNALSFANSSSFTRQVNHPSQALAVAKQAPPPPLSASETAVNTDSLQAAVVATERKASIAQPPSVFHRGKSPAPKTQATPSFSAAKDSSVLAISATGREASHRTDIATEKIDKELVRNNLSNLVSLGASAYTVGTFGGISDLQLTVSNHSVYPLDLVVVEIQYIQANKKVFKTETLNFRGIPAGSALMQEAPRSSRGIKVGYKITIINSKESGLSYSLR